ncbi:hypothetical protein [Vibrio salinus]|uniref:hypothetical protein n=1 Tax=Vibrio salinus TaxID=2899784 RepID=UPI001E3C22C9|nr:hypothetical protein [Vibrio salinus]MCE0493887.1 hypothetical protein [Vibrio salinus]
MHEILTVEDLVLYAPIFATFITALTLWNTVKGRRQDYAIKLRDLELKKIERKERVQYQHPHIYKDLFVNFSDPKCLYKPTCKLVIANRDTRDVVVEEIKWAISTSSRWQVNGQKFEPRKLSLSDKIEFEIDTDKDFIFYESGSVLSHIHRILNICVWVKLSTDSGRTTPLNVFYLQRYLVYRDIKSFPARWWGLYQVCKQHNYSFLAVLI